MKIANREIVKSSDLKDIRNTQTQLMGKINNQEFLKEMKALNTNDYSDPTDFGADDWDGKSNSFWIVKAEIENFQNVFAHAFTYDGLEDTGLEGKFIERILFNNGKVGIYNLTKNDNKLYASQIINTKFDNNNRPTGKLEVIDNGTEGSNTTKSIKGKIVYGFNDLNGTPTIQKIWEPIRRLGDEWIEEGNNSILSRNSVKIKGVDEGDAKKIWKNSVARKPIETIVAKFTNTKDELTAAGKGNTTGSGEVDSVATDRTDNIWKTINNLREYAFTLLGIPRNVMKNERLTPGEIVAQNIYEQLICGSLLKEREDMCKRINDTFGTNITVKLNDKIEGAFNPEIITQQETNTEEPQ